MSDLPCGTLNPRGRLAWTCVTGFTGHLLLPGSRPSQHLACLVRMLLQKFRP